MVAVMSQREMNVRERTQRVEGFQKTRPLGRLPEAVARLIENQPLRKFANDSIPLVDAQLKPLPQPLCPLT